MGHALITAVVSTVTLQTAENIGLQIYANAMHVQLVACYLDVKWVYVFVCSTSNKRESGGCSLNMKFGVKAVRCMQ